MKKSINRRQFIKNSSLVVGGLLVSSSFKFPRANLQFGWVTDIHYAEAPEKWGRFFTEGVSKLNEAVELFNKKKVDFVIETGDFKDQNEPSVESKTLTYLNRIEEQFSAFNGDRYHVLGNHDLDSLSKKQFLSVVTNSGIDKDKSYYFFDKSGFRFVVLDACYKANGEDYDHNNYHWTDTNITNAQLVWFKGVLKESPYPVIVFVHQLLDGEGDLFVNDARAVTSVMEKSKKVKAVFQGHHHKGSIRVVNGILYYTLKAMVEGSGEQNNSYTIVTLTKNEEIIIDGYRRADDYSFRE